MAKIIQAILYGLRPVGREVGGFFLSILVPIGAVVSAIGLAYLGVLGALWGAAALLSADLSGDAWEVAQVVKYGPWGAILDASIIVITVGHAAYTAGLKELQFRKSLRDFNDSKTPKEILD